MPSKKRSKTNNFVVQGGILALAGVITRIIGMFYRIPVTNIIGDEGNGYYAAAYQIYNIMLLISSYSLPLAISKIVSARYSRQDYTNSDRVFRGGLFFALISGGIACLLVFFGAGFFAGNLMTEPMSAIALRIFAPTLLVVALMGVIRGYFQGMGTMVPTAVSQIIEQIVNAIVSILAAQTLYSYGFKVAKLLKNEHYAPAYGAAGSTLGTSSGALAGLIFLAIVLLLTSASIRRNKPKDSVKAIEPMGDVIRLIMLTAVPVILSTAIYNISDVLDNGMFNKIMTIKGQGVEKTAIWGIYSGKYKLMMNIPIALANAMCSSVVPTLASCIAADNVRGAKRKIFTAIRVTMLIAIPCCVGMAVLAKPMLSMLFTGDLTLAARLMQVGSISIIFFSISTLTNGILQGINHLEIPVRHSAISLVLHITALYFMLNYTDLGIYAVVFANILFAFLMCIMNQFSIRKYLKYKQEIPRTFIIPAISATIMGIVVFAVYSLLSKLAANILSTLISMLIGTFVYCFCILRLRGVREEEINEIPGGTFFAHIARFLHMI
ncbi:MAG: polysaccharide biosynthesis protein [Lachnospiraceae bacterium]|nr:polysaccharide biosynthesis protein [Lachnospiraceae bacterium]